MLLSDKLSNKGWIYLCNECLVICSCSRLNNYEIITVRKRSLGQGNIFAPVCHSVHRWGEGMPQCMLGYHHHPVPPDHAPPWGHAPPTPAPPDHAHTPPRRACWQIRSTRGRYASYWNAILFNIILKIISRARADTLNFFLLEFWAIFSEKVCRNSNCIS